MGSLRTAAVECNYKELDRQLKEQFIHGLNDSEMLTEIIRELTKSDANLIILSEHVLTWIKRVKVQRAQATVINSLHELQNFDAILKMDKGIQRETKSTKPVETPAGGRCKYCGQVHKLKWCPVYGKKCEKCNTMTHLKRYGEVQKAVWSIT